MIGIIEAAGAVDGISAVVDAHSFDIIVCKQIFEHLKNIFKPSDQIACALKPGGIFNHFSS